MVPQFTDPKSDRRRVRFWQMVDEWIERSAGLRLFLALEDSPGCDYDWLVCAACQQLYQRVFKKYFSRIQHLEGVTRHLFTQFSSEPYPMVELQSLVFNVISVKAGRKRWSSLSSFTPNLVQLSLHDTISQPYSLASLPPLRNLTHLSTRIYGYKAWIEHFRLCPRLQKAVIYYCRISPFQMLPDSFDKGAVSLLKLTSLTVIFANDGTGVDLGMFYCMDMPSLLTLRLGSFHLRGFIIPAGRPPPMVLDHVKTVQRLSLIFNNLSRPEFLDFLLNLPDLEILDIQDCLDIEQVFSDLQIADEEYSHTPFLPRLRTIILDIRQVVEIDFKVLQAHLDGFLTGRRNNDRGCSLHIKFYFSGPALKAFRTFRYGMKFKLQGFSHEFVFWDQDVGWSGSRWKYRLDTEEGRWVEGIR